MITLESILNCCVGLEGEGGEDMKKNEQERIRSGNQRKIAAVNCREPFLSFKIDLRNFKAWNDDTDNKNESDMINKLCAIKMCKTFHVPAFR